MSRGGYIKLHRKILNWKWFQSPNTVVVWLALLMLAEWDNGCDIRAGQVEVSQQELSEITGLSRQQIRTAIAHLVSTKEVTKESTKKATKGTMLLTIENWRLYQSDNRKSNQGSNQGSNQESNLPTIIKENKEIKEIKEGQSDEASEGDFVPMPEELKEKLLNGFKM